MHDARLPPDLVANVAARRGRPHVFDDLRPQTTALVVVDMQNAFTPHPEAHAPCEMAPRIIPQINRLAAAVRRAGGVVVWIQTACTPADIEGWSNVRALMGGETGGARRARALAPGSEGYALCPGLEALPADLYVQKHRFSAFVPGSSDLDATLRARGIETLLVAGTVTNVCCESTARDAMMMDYKVIMVSDANAAHSDEDHNASLALFYQAFGDVMDTGQLVGILGRAQRTDASRPAAHAAP